MIRQLCILIYIAIFALLAPFFALANSELSQIPKSADGFPTFAPVVESAMPAVVNISTTQSVDARSPFEDLRNELPEGSLFEFFFKDFMDRELGDKNGEFGGRKRKAVSLGSGFIIDENGYIVTNFHVIEGADQISITLSDDVNKTYPAKVIGTDKKTDIALLKINVDKKLPYLKFGNSEQARVGDFIVAIGNPFGLGGSVTVGIISAKSRFINGQYDEFIQTDASINRGNSGGPMLNMKSEVIGINSVIISTTGGNIGIGFAIPSMQAEAIINQLKTKGFITRGWLGVAIQPLNEDIAKNLGVEAGSGAIVSEVLKDSPAYKAGVKIGDIIVSFDGVKIDKPNKLSKLVADTAINNKSVLQILRDGKKQTITVSIAKLENQPEALQTEEPSTTNSKPSEILLGMKLENLDDNIKAKYKLDKSITGAIVTRVVRNSPAADIGIKQGDLILQINKVKVNSVSDISAEISRSKTSGLTNVVLLVSRGGTNRYIVIDLE